MLASSECVDQFIQNPDNGITKVFCFTIVSITVIFTFSVQYIEIGMGNVHLIYYGSWMSYVLYGSFRPLGSLKVGVFGRANKVVTLNEWMNERRPSKCLIKRHSWVIRHCGSVQISKPYFYHTLWRRFAFIQLFYLS